MDEQIMMHGPLTQAQLERARVIDAHGHAYGERIVRIVEAAPPLTEDQRTRLFLLLNP